MSELKWRELFPTKWSILVFILYMVLFINQGILVTASQNRDKGYSYNTITAVLLTELIKLIVSSGLFIQRYVKLSHKRRRSFIFLYYLVRKSVVTFIHEVSKNTRVLFLYFIPALLYCLYNNLAYTNLATFDPTTYFLLLQLRVVVTGVVFQILFKKKLSMHQWISLILLTFGCMIKEINITKLFGFNQDKIYSRSPMEDQDPMNKIVQYGTGIFFIILQVICSSSAGVYNEYLLKEDSSATVPVLVQNTCLYIDSIICNIMFLAFQGDLTSGLNLEAFQTIFTSPIILLVVINNAAIGIVTSFFLAQLNSILKTFASALELMFTAVLCWMIFGIPIYMNTVLAIAVVTFAIYLYSLQPVVNRGKLAASSKESSPEKQKMLEQENV